MERLRQIQADDDERRVALRALGALLLGAGVVVLLTRRTSFENPWGDLTVFLVLLLTAGVLYGGGMAAARSATAPTAWHAVWLVFGVAFIYATLQQFLELIDADGGAALNVAWTSAVVAAASAAAAILAGVRFGWLLAGIALTVAWLALWDEILSAGLGDDIGTFRGLCMVAAGLLLAGGWMLHRREITDRAGSLELVTAAGLVFVLGAGLISALGAIASSILGAVAPVGAVDTTGIAEPSLFWDAVLLAGSVALIGLANLAGARGPAYVGVIGLTVFITVVGGDLDNDDPTGSILGWPLLLLLAGAAAIAASVWLTRRPPPV